MKLRRVSAWRRGAPAAGLLALAAYFAAAVPLGLGAAWARLHVARDQVRDDARAAFVRQRGKDYVAAIERIRAAIPEDGEYLLLETDGIDMLVRFDLAPRRARSGGFLKDVATNVTKANLATLPRLAVVPNLAGPRLVETRLIAEAGAVP